MAIERGRRVLQPRRAASGVPAVSDSWPAAGGGARARRPARRPDPGARRLFEGAAAGRRCGRPDGYTTMCRTGRPPGRRRAPQPAETSASRLARCVVLRKINGKEHFPKHSGCRRPPRCVCGARPASDAPPLSARRCVSQMTPWCVCERGRVVSAGRAPQPRPVRRPCRRVFGVLSVGLFYCSGAARRLLVSCRLLSPLASGVWLPVCVCVC